MDKYYLYIVQSQLEWDNIFSTQKIDISLVKKDTVFLFYIKHNTTPGFIGYCLIDNHNSIIVNQFDNVINIKSINTVLNYDAVGYKSLISFRCKFLNCNKKIQLLEYKGQDILLKLLNVSNNLSYSNLLNSISDSTLTDIFNDVGNDTCYSTNNNTCYSTNNNTSNDIFNDSLKDDISYINDNFNACLVNNNIINSNTDFNTNSILSPSNGSTIKTNSVLTTPTTPTTPTTLSTPYTLSSIPPTSIDYSIDNGSTVKTNLTLSTVSSVKTANNTINKFIVSDPSIKSSRKSSDAYSELDSYNSTNNVPTIQIKKNVSKIINTPDKKQTKINISNNDKIDNKIGQKPSKIPSKKPPSKNQEKNIDTVENNEPFDESDGDTTKSKSENIDSNDSDDSDTDNQDDSDDSDNTESDEQKDGMIPILMIPCSSFKLTSMNIQKKCRYIMNHFISCINCDKYDNNNINICGYMTNATFDYMEIKRSSDIDYKMAINAYHKMSNYITYTNEKPYINFIHIKCQGLYTDCILVCWNI
jgi:hypothetical protein